jgi:Domain of Unknown Function (DUF1080)
MRLSLTLIALLFVTAFLSAQTPDNRDPAVTEIWTPKPKKVTPGSAYGEPPSDAIVLFDGKDLSKWASAKEGDAKWEVKDGAVTVVKGAGDIKTKQTFGDIQLHIEFREPTNSTGEGQGRGNSGVFFSERYELQVLDSYESPTYSNGQAGSIYKQHMPLVNATRIAGEWQAYDVVFNAPRFSESGSLDVPARITVFHNGVVIQNNTSIWGATGFRGLPAYSPHGKASLQLQEHGNAVSYRNIWVREL